MHAIVAANAMNKHVARNAGKNGAVTANMLPIMHATNNSKAIFLFFAFILHHVELIVKDDLWFIQEI